ncbi:MAG: molybdopterin molybdenumtransferase MoeA [Chloroflexi bacterium]|nr:MAG: molybdopterin molybdenumtransferase MoeA [Chloroflexota bacterium]MBL1194197.1 molybdopterin molybdenumtransferase MoeA [Chloroflexota bacterium]NOH11490.1 molybdopterin molybdenumtransferase MoeA [Chloroflexota bacterium]
MPEFLTLLPPLEARQNLLDNFTPNLESETIDTQSALGRVTAGPVTAPFSLPSFARSTVDGFAVRAADTHGAGESLPAYLNNVGEVPMGGVPDFGIEATQCAVIHTGGMLPEGADGVVMIEYTQAAKAGEIEIMRAVGVGENILQVGEDVKERDVVIPAGSHLRPAEIGGLMALGIKEIATVRPPRVAILSSGDEVISPDEELNPGQVYDVNSYTLSALVQQHGGIPVQYGIVPDDAESLKAEAQSAKGTCDLVVITAGSSASTRDLTAGVIDSLGKPGVLVHGVNVRPGKPTILGVCDGVPMIGLPGNPVSALVIARLFVAQVIEAMLGLETPPITSSISATLSINLSSQAGREDWVPVQLQAGENGYVAEPVFGKSNLIFTLSRADGLVRIPPAANGLAAGDVVEVQLM